VAAADLAHRDELVLVGAALGRVLEPRRVAPRALLQCLVEEVAHLLQLVGPGGPAENEGVKLAGQHPEPVERGVVVGQLPGRAQPTLDRCAVTLGQVIEDVSLLVADAALHRHRAEHLTDRGPQLGIGEGALDRRRQIACVALSGMKRGLPR